MAKSPVSAKPVVYLPEPVLIANPGKGYAEAWAEARAQLTNAHWKILANLSDPLTRTVYRGDAIALLQRAGYLDYSGTEHQSPYVTDRGRVALFEHDGGDYAAYCREHWGDRYGSPELVRYKMNGMPEYVE